MTDRTPGSSPGSSRLRELDVLRGFAALAVVCYHYVRHEERYVAALPFSAAYGRYGVELFFVISGFVIFFTLQHSRSVGDFVFSRFSRLYPTYWAVLSILLLNGLLVYHTRPWWGGYLVNATMLQRFLGFGDLDVVFWSLAVELAFYTVMAAIFALGWLPRIVPLAAIWLAATVAWSYATGFGGSPTAGEQTYFVPYSPYFIGGVMFYLLWAEGPRRAYLALLAAAWLTIAAVDGFPDAWLALGMFTITAAALAGRLAWLVNPLTLWLGAISYPLYLVHRNLGYEFLFWFKDHHVSQLVALAFTLAASLALASALSWAIERPATRLLRAWYRSAHEPIRQ